MRDDLLPWAKNSIFSGSAPFVAVKSVVSFLNGSFVRNGIARFGGRPMRHRIEPRPS